MFEEELNKPEIALNKTYAKQKYYTHQFVEEVKVLREEHSVDNSLLFAN